MNQEQPKIDGRSKEARAAKAAPTYEQEVQSGFEAAKANSPVPDGATKGFLEGYEAGKLPPPPPPKLAKADPTTAWDDEEPNETAGDFEEQPRQQNQIFTPPPPKPAPQNTVLVCRAESVIRAAHDRAVEETKVAQALLDDPLNPVKQAAFEKKYNKMEIPPPPARTPYGDADEDWLKWEAAWKPDEFLRKNKQRKTEFVLNLIKEVEARKAAQA